MHRCHVICGHLTTSSSSHHDIIITPHPSSASSTTANETWSFSGASLHCAAASTAGSLHDGSRKTNQDACGLFFGGNMTPKTEQFSHAPLLIAVVCDGHGVKGELVSGLTKRLMTGVLASTSNIVMTDSMMGEMCDKVSMRIKQELTQESITSGCTCVAMVICENRKLVCFNVGDSRAVGCSKTTQLAVELTRDHKPDDPSELERIRIAGGTVRKRPGDVARVAGLALSRAFGDFAGTSSGVICTPDMTVFDCNQFDFVVVASDGVYDVMTSQEVIDFVKDDAGINSPLHVAEQLVQRCRALWLLDTDGRYCDDVTAVVIVFDE